jgi:hypothetical protein
MAYVYRHIRLDKNQPFYIGIGTDLTYKRAKEKSRRNRIWNKIADKTDIDIEILFDGLSFEEAKIKEIEFIKLYGRIDTNTGILSNMTDGGDGTINKIYTKEYREKLSIAAKKRQPQPQLQKIIEYRKTKFVFTPEIRNKLSLAHKGKKLNTKQIELLKQRIGDKNPMFGKRNYNYLGLVYAYKDGKFIGSYEGVHKAAKELDVQATKISAVINGKRKTTKGFTFKRNLL